MNAKDFSVLFENRVSQCRNMLIKKADEYASDTDQLHNFKVGARLLDTTPEKALFGMMAKHLISVMNLVNDPSKATQYLINEKISDNINYLILLEALLTERLTQTTKSERYTEIDVLRDINNGNYEKIFQNKPISETKQDESTNSIRKSIKKLRPRPGDTEEICETKAEIREYDYCISCPTCGFGILFNGNPQTLNCTNCHNITSNPHFDESKP